MLRFAANFKIKLYGYDDLQSIEYGLQPISETSPIFYVSALS
jgi:hypothetical protein